MHFDVLDKRLMDSRVDFRIEPPNGMLAECHWKRYFEATGRIYVLSVPVVHLTMRARITFEVITLLWRRFRQRNLMRCIRLDVLYVAVVSGTLKAFRNRGLEDSQGRCRCIICTVGVWREVGRSLDESGAAV